MLITFHSAAAADVIMFGKNGQQMLQIVGKDPAERQGIVTVEQLPQAIARLTAAIEADRACALASTGKKTAPVDRCTSSSPT
jgi:hypothetical protein